MSKCGHRSGYVYDRTPLVCAKSAHTEGDHCLLISYREPGPTGVVATAVFWDGAGKVTATSHMIKGETIEATDPPDMSEAMRRYRRFLLEERARQASRTIAAPEVPVSAPLPTPRPRVIVPAESPRYSGDPCPACGAMLVVRTGACETCQGCGHNDGCG